MHWLTNGYILLHWNLYILVTLGLLCRGDFIIQSGFYVNINKLGLELVTVIE